jgi:hypothetical protein
MVISPKNLARAVKGSKQSKSTDGRKWLNGEESEPCNGVEDANRGTARGRGSLSAP